MRGSGKKLWKQKGTGRARVGSIRTPLWRHGGIVHGPQPRNYAYQLPRKMQKGALRSALSGKLRDGELKVMHELTPRDHKTKAAVGALKALGAPQGRARDAPLDEKFAILATSMACAVQATASPRATSPTPSRSC